ncbi:MAG: adenylate cyclase [Acidimicrobiales bacterium]
MATSLAGAVPGPIVNRAARLAAPLARVSGFSSAGTAALGAVLAHLAQPPMRARPRSELITIDDIAGRVGRPTDEVEQWARRGLLGRAADAAGGRWEVLVLERAALIDLALRRGIPDEVLVQAAGEGTLVLLAFERALSVGTLSASQVAARTHVEPERVEAVWRALGFAVDDRDSPMFGRREVHAMRILRALTAVFTEDDLLEATSVVGRSMSHVAVGVVELFRRRISDPFLAAGEGDLDVMLRLAAVEELLVPAVLPLLEVAFRRHLEATVRGEVATQMEQLAGTDRAQRVLAVAFADIVGFTSASESLSALEVATMAAGLLRSAEGAVSAHGGRIIKSIGDAVMYTTPDPLSCAMAAAGIAEGARVRRLPPVRVGVAFGPVLPAYADLFGRTVNVASRLCGAAVPDQMLVHAPGSDIDVAQWSEAGLPFERTQVSGLKGIDGTLDVYRVAL